MTASYQKVDQWKLLKLDIGLYLFGLMHTFICQYTTTVYKWLKIKEQNEAAKGIVYNWIYKY